ncbi:MAG: response regulator [Candidatus Heimdallarchaeota archaeon]
MGRREYTQDISQKLRILGLTTREAEVVVTLLQSSTHLGANEVALKKGIARPYVHDLLRKLVRMNVVTKMQGKTGRSVYGCSMHNLHRFVGAIRTNYEENLRTLELFEKSPHPESYISRLLEILGHSSESYSVYSILIETGEKSLKDLAGSAGLSYSRIRQIVSNLTIEGFLNRRRRGTSVFISATLPALAVEQACKIATNSIQAQIDELGHVLQSLAEGRLSSDLDEIHSERIIPSDSPKEIIKDSSAKVLVVEDHDALRESLVEIIMEEGNQAKGTSNAQDALSLLRSETFDIVVSDIKMPGMDGIELLRRTRERELPTDFIIITGFGTLGTAQEAIRLGAKDYILKPVEPSSFARVIADVYEQQKTNKLAARNSNQVKKRLGILDRKAKLLQQVIQELIQRQIKQGGSENFKSYLFIPEQSARYGDIAANTKRILQSYPIFDFSTHSLIEEAETLMGILDKITEDGVKIPSKITSPTLFLTVGSLHDYCDPSNEIEIHETVLSLIRRFYSSS